MFVGPVAKSVGTVWNKGSRNALCLPSCMGSVEEAVVITELSRKPAGLSAARGPSDVLPFLTGVPLLLFVIFIIASDPQRVQGLLMFLRISSYKARGLAT